LSLTKRIIRIIKSNLFQLLVMPPGTVRVQEKMLGTPTSTEKSTVSADISADRRAVLNFPVPKVELGALLLDFASASICNLINSIFLLSWIRSGLMHQLLTFFSIIGNTSVPYKTGYNLGKGDAMILCLRVVSDIYPGRYNSHFTK
jgi:hypothetical protein